MTHTDWISSLTIMAIGGFAFGLLYFAALKRTVLTLASHRGVLAPLSLTLGRVAAAVGFLALAARLGAAPLLAAFVGFLVARAVALRRERRIG